MLGQHSSCHSVKAVYVQLGLMAGRTVESSRWSRRKVPAHKHGDMASGYVRHKQVGEVLMFACVHAMFTCTTTVCIRCYAGFVVEREFELWDW